VERVVDVDSDATRVHHCPAGALLDAILPEYTRQTSDRGPRRSRAAVFRAWSRTLAAAFDATSLAILSIKTLRKHATSASVTSAARSSAPAVCLLASGHTRRSESRKVSCSRRAPH